MSGRLRSRLLGIGRAAATRSESGGLRFFALALATLSLVLSVAAVLIAVTVEASRESRMAAGELVTAEPSTSTVLVKRAIDHLQGGRQFTVVFVSPAGDGAPLPPGLAAWPERGTAVVSPELLREGAEQGISGRYGEVAGTIGEPGLADATELLAYVRPVQDLDLVESNAMPVSGFGGSGDELSVHNVHWLLADQDFDSGALAVLLVALALVPSLLLALVAAKVASHSRDRRDALVTALGGRVTHRLWIALGEAWAPVSLGAVGAVAVLAWFAVADRRLPIVDYVVPAADISWWALALGTVGAAAFVLSAAVIRSAISASGPRPLRHLADRTRRARVVLFPCFVLLAAWGPSLLTGYVGLLGAVLTMPTAIGVGVAALGRALARRGHSPALLTSGRRMAHRPEAIARQVSGVCACIVFLLFALTMQSTLSSNAAAADAFVEEYGHSLVEVHPRGAVTAAQVDEFVAALPSGIEVVAYTESQVTGTCPALTALALPCAGGEALAPAEAFDAWLAGAPVPTAQAGAPSSAVADGAVALLAFTAGDDIAAGVLNNAGVAFPYGVATSVPGESWQVGAVPPLEQSGWITLIGGFGLAVLILATGLGLAGEFLRFGRAIAPLSVLTGNRRIFWRASALVSLVPLAAAVAGAFSVGYFAVRPLATSDLNLVTPSFVGICCAAALVAGLVVWSWSAMAAVGSADRWRPGRDD